MKLAPWESINSIRFMKEMLYNEKETDKEHGVILQVENRNVQSGRWWTLKWTSVDGLRREVSAQKLENIGLDVAKPDRHLKRLAREYNFDTIQGMCEFLASQVDERIGTVDVILWRALNLGLRKEAFDGNQKKQ